MAQFHDLDDRINSVATKVVHLGDQLENMSIPRQRVQETEQIMKYFDEFHSNKELSPVFNDKNKVSRNQLLVISVLNFVNIYRLHILLYFYNFYVSCKVSL